MNDACRPSGHTICRVAAWVSGAYSGIQTRGRTKLNFRFLVGGIPLAPPISPAPNLQCLVLNLFLGRVRSISKTIVFDRSHVCRSEGRPSRACRNSQHDLLFPQGRAVWYEGSKNLRAEAHSMMSRFGKRGRSGMQGQSIPLRTHFVKVFLCGLTSFNSGLNLTSDSFLEVPPLPLRSNVAVLLLPSVGCPRQKKRRARWGQVRQPQ